MNTAEKKKLVRGMLVGVISIVLTLGLWTLGWLETWELKSWDWRVALFARPVAATNDIRLIELDQASLEWGQQQDVKLAWPWPRQVFAAIIDFCRRSEVKALAFDVLFTEPSFWDVSDDEMLGTAIAEFGKFAGALALGNVTGSDTQWPADLPSPNPRIADVKHWLPPAMISQIISPRTKIPILEVAQHAAVLCNVQQNPGRDGIYRDIKILSIFDQRVFPSLGIGLYLAAHPNAQFQMAGKQVVLDNHPIPLDHTGQVVLRYRGPSGTHKAYSAVDILNAESRSVNGEDATEWDRFIAADLKDRYVFFGYSAPGLLDLRPVPLDGEYPGVEINATVLDNLLTGDFMRKTPIWMTIVLLAVLAILGAILILLCTNPIQDIFIGVGFLCLPVGLSVGAYALGWWLPLAPVETATAIAILTSIVLDYMTEGRQKRFIKDAFKHYLSPAVIEQIIQHPEQLKLGGERRTLSIFFSDLQGFTSLSEGLSPEDLTALLNEYLTAMTDIIHEEQGTIDKYEGDAIIAFWNAPLSVPDHADRAVRAALRCQAKLTDMRPAFRARVNKDLFMRVGVNTGAAVVGNMGSRSHFDYTMIGDAVNLASRLEGANKQFGTYTMVSQFTVEQIADSAFATRELARIAVVGRAEPVVVYEPMVRETYAANKEVFETFAEALALFYRGSFTHARELFTVIRDRDPAAAAYADKCRSYIMNPPDNWNGVWVLTSK